MRIRAYYPSRVVHPGGRAYRSAVPAIDDHGLQREAQVTTAQVPVPLARSALSRIGRAGLATAIVDGIFAVVLNVGIYDGTFARLWQNIAFTLLGRAAFDGGGRTVGIGLLMHCGVALAWSAVFVGLAQRSARVRGVLRSPSGVLKVGAVYGPFIWIVMSMVVIPLLVQRPPAPITVRWWVNFIGHIPFVGWPLVWAARSAEER